MPVYEYRCEPCGKKFSVLVGVVAGGKKEKSVACPKCGGKNVYRVISRVSFKRSEEDMLEDLADPEKMGDLNDPQNLRKLTERMGKQFGDDLGEDFSESLGGMEDEMRGESGSTGSFDEGGGGMDSENGSFDEV